MAFNIQDREINNYVVSFIMIELKKMAQLNAIF